MAGIEAGGKAFLGLIKFIKNERGKDFLNEVVESLDPESKQVFKKPIFATKWYPYRSFAMFLEAIQKKMSNGDPLFFHRVGMNSGRLDLGSIFRIYKTLASSERLIRSCGMLWSGYYRNAGEMKAVSWTSDNTVLQISNFPQMSSLHCLLMEGWMAVVLEEIGLQIVSYKETKCMSKGDSCHEFVYVWKKK